LNSAFEEVGSWKKIGIGGNCEILKIFTSQTFESKEAFY
jgi:hypothetical protein